MADLYIYYRVPAQHVEALLPRVRAMQARVAKGAARCQLKCRSNGDAAGQTWMEVYQQVTPEFETQLASAALAAGLAGFIEGARHTEVFAEFTPCA